ncbi:MAG: alanine racemase [Acidimicrobiales bacterium]
MPAEGVHRPAWAEIDLAAIRHNAKAMAAIAAPAGLCAVVKADGYGHAAVPVAKAAIAGGARELAVALVDEGVELRDAGVSGRVLVLSEPAADAMEDALSCGLVPTLYSLGGVEAARKAARALGAGSGSPPLPVEVKLDTGMHRVGAAPEALCSIVEQVVLAPELEYAGLWTHFAVADEVEDGFTSEQLARFESARRELRRAGLDEPGRVHAANSAGAIAWPAARYDVVRCGIALYGYAPSKQVDPVLAAELARVAMAPLRPALSWKAKVTMTREYDTGERLSYGREAALPAPSLVATVPLGYCDGVPRRYFPGGGVVLIGGRRCPLAGRVTMDQIVVSCEPGARVSEGDVAVLIGAQGGEVVTADEWAERLGTVSYEVLTRIGQRVPRRMVDSDEAGRR